MSGAGSAPGREPTVSAGDIARLAGVGRAAVSNWRRRFTDFPEPVAGPAASPLYRLADVERWLDEHDRAASVPALERAWQSVRAGTDELGLGDAVAAAGALLAGGHASGSLPAPAAGRVLDAGRDSGADSAHEYLVERYLDTCSRRVPAPQAPLARAMVRLARVAGTTVLDPACGTGALLRAAVEAGASGVAGQERDPTAARICEHRIRLAASGEGAVTAGDALHDDGVPGRRFGAVVCVPPSADRNWGFEELAGDPRWTFGLPPRLESELAWVQHCLAHAADGAAVVVLLPAGVAYRRSGRRIRNGLLRAGALDAVIGLPRGSGPPTDLWVLHRPPDGAAPAERVLIARAGSVEDAERAWSGFRSGETVGAARTLRPINLLDDDVDLSPDRHVPVEPEHINHADAVAGFERALEALPAVPDLRAVDPGEARARTTVGDLVRAGAITILQGPLRQTNGRSGDRSVPVLTARDVASGREASGSTDPTVPGLVALELGDVVVPVPVAREASAVVVGRAGAVLGPRTLALRVDPERLDPHYLAGLLCAAAAGDPRSTGRSDVRRIALPVPAIDHQRTVGTAFRHLTEFEAGLRTVREAGEALARSAVHGLGAGTLVPER